MDEIYSFVKNHEDVNNKIASELKRFCDDNEYDTDAIEYDTNVLHYTSSNISYYIRSKACIDAIQQCIKNLKCMLVYSFYTPQPGEH